MIHPLRPVTEPPELHRPILIAAFDGWNDAGEAASQAVERVIDASDVTLIAESDDEALYDYTANRPVTTIVSEGVRKVEWPSLAVHAGTLPSGAPVVVLSGPEPNFAWRGLCEAVIDLCGRLGVERAVTLGALQVDRPHTRGIGVVGGSSDPAVADEVGVRTSRYEGPTGITGVLGGCLAAAGITHVSLWAGVPHYLAGTAHLAAVLALCEHLERVVPTGLDLSGLAHDSAEQADEIAELLAADDDLAEYVADLERRAPDPDDGVGDGEDVVVDGEHLAAELERYLRGRNSG